MTVGTMKAQLEALGGAQVSADGKDVTCAPPPILRASGPDLGNGVGCSFNINPVGDIVPSQINVNMAAWTDECRMLGGVVHQKDARAAGADRVGARGGRGGGGAAPLRTGRDAVIEAGAHPTAPIRTVRIV